MGGKTKGKETDSEDDDAAEEVKAEGEVPPALEKNAEGKQKETKKDMRKDENVEPLTYNSLPREFFEDNIISLNVAGSYDLSPMDGENAVAHMRQKKQCPV